MASGVRASDDLDVSGATTAVATEDLDRAAEQLDRLSGEASTMAVQLGRIEPVAVPGIFFARQAAIDVDLATAGLHDVARRAGLLHTVLVTAAQGYIVTERIVGLAARGVETLAAQWFGARLATMALTAGGIAAVSAGIWAGLVASGGVGKAVNAQFDHSSRPKDGALLRGVNGLLTNESTVSLLRGLAQSVGPALLGAAGAPTGAAQLFGTRAYEFGARGIIGPARTVGLLRETGVTLVERIPQEVSAPPRDAAPHNYTDRLSRVPHGGDGGPERPQVIIERYTVEGQPDRFEVYVGGTVTFSPSSPTEPWDMTSNLANAAGWESGSVEAVREAMADAGIDEKSPVQFTGYSQGGGTAARLAASGLFNTQGLTTFGGPTGQVELPGGFPTVLVEHTDDPVPALGGEQDNEGAVLVRRNVFDGGPLPRDLVAPAHHYDYYRETAQLMDGSRSPQLDDTIRRLDSFTAGARLESSTGYRFVRTEER